MNERSISAKDYLEKVYGDFPRSAIYMSGLRHREKLTQKQLGKIIGTNQSYISLMERGLRPIGKNITQRLKAIIGKINE